MLLRSFDIAAKNLRRKFFRSITIALSVAVVGATIFSITTVMNSVEKSLHKGASRLGADIIVVPAEAESKAKMALLAGEPSTFYMDKSIVEKIRKIDGVKSVASQVFLKTAQYRCCDTSDMLIIGFDQDNDFTIMPWLTKMKKERLSGDEAVMGRALTAFNVGSNVRLYGMYFKIVGMLEETGMKFIDYSIFMPSEAVRNIVENSKKADVQSVNLMSDQISTVLVQVDPEINPSRVAIYIEYAIKGVKAIVSENVISSVRKQLFILLRSILSITVILWIMAFLLIGVVFSMIVNERQRELGLLRAMGAKKRDLLSLILTEASTLSIIGGIFGIISGGVFLFFIRGFIRATLKIPYIWPSPLEFVVLIFICLNLALLTGIGAALYPAIRSMKLEPYIAIRQGE